MMNISVSIGEVVTEITTDQQVSFDVIETLLNRATASALNAYNLYFVSIEDYEKAIEDYEQMPGDEE